MSRQKNLKRNLLICLLAGSAVMYTLPLHAATSVVANNALPQGGQFFNGNEFVAGSVIDNKQQFTGIDGNVIGSIAKPNDLTMNVHQANQNAVIKWGSFDVGGSATVNFTSNASNFNTLNYVNSGSASQIYGTINGLGGNIYVVNTAGVQIGPSAQINVGSLYVSNKNLDNVNWEAINNVNPDINSIMGQGATGDAALMSLGNINATNVTFEGNGRIVIDSERIKNDANNATFRVNTNDAGNVVIGYDAYNEVIYNEDGTIKKDKGTYDGKDKNFTGNVFVNGTNPSEAVKGYMWVEDVEQLQAINTNLGGNYALRNSIDATSTAQGTGFNPIGLDDNGKVVVHDGNKYGFTGKFDGIDYNIFGLNINRPGEINVGLFGVAHDANINNVTLVGGSITGGSVVGSVVGAALGNTHITNATNSASVTGNTDVGGIVGYSGDELDNVGDSGSDITGIDTNSHFTNLVNTGTVHSKGESDGNRGIVSNAGGLIGYMYNGKLDGNSYNLGDVSGKGYNVGGLVGHAVNSTIGNEGEDAQLVYNRLDVEGAYNVGGIVGNMEGTTVQNAENSGNVTATGYDNGEYTFHTDYTVNHYSSNGIKTVDVNLANVGGIAGTASANSTITDVLNTADVSSKQQNNNDYYDAGNVGGIVGSAVDTNISNATNKENEVRGAHNVGGVAGYFSGAGRITGGINDGGDIMATGARYTNNGATAVVTETIRKDYDGSNNDGKYVIGNIGGIVGYMEGDNVHIDASGNRGTVHTLDISDGNNISDASEAANVGGIVGKIDRSSKITDKNELGENYVNAAVSNSYNTGDVRGFTAIGGIAGMMYNGGIAGAYNLGEIRSTRVATGNETPLNMGGIVGDTTEVSNARAFIYDVYNKGKIGDEAFKYKGRHVGGIVGRLSGVVEKAYNTGAIYNGAAVTGGIAGYLSAGKIENVFNTGNITVENNDGEDLGTQLGGLVGAANIGRGNVNISNAYNLGVIRSFNGDKTQHNVGGIVGYLVNYTSGIQGENAGNLTIKNVYTTGDLYSEGRETTVGALYGGRRENVTNPIIQNAVYITPSNNAFTEVAYGNLQDATEVTGIYGSSEATTNVWNNFIQQSNVNNEGQTLDLWRVYDGTTPILNAFMPNSKDYFGDENKYSTGSNTGIDKIQYGTAYNPLLTIINANKDLVYDWEKLGINNDAGLAVYGYGVTLNNFRATGGTGYFGGTIYADGALNLNGNSDIGLGSASQIYGSDVTIGTNGKVTIYGDVTATGNEKDNNDTTGSISINAGEVDVYGALTSAKKDQQIQISGIAGSVNPGFNFENITDKTKPVTNVGDSFAHEVTASETGNITINAGQNGTGSGNVNLYYGNKQEGLITTGGDLTATGSGDVYVDSDLDIGGDLTLTGNGENSEVVLDLTNIGQVQAKNGTIVDAVTGLHNFMHHFSDTSGGGVQADNKTISLNSASGNSKITVDMWDYENDKFSLEKYDETTAVGHTFREELNNLNLKVDNTVVAEDKVKEHIYIWVSDGEQLQGINATANDGGLDFNYALKGDINASDVENYVAIGTNSANGFTGTFDGRGNRIIGLDTTKDANDGNTNFMVNAGIFSTIGKDGTVKNVNIYSGNFEGANTAGAVAGINNGRIENIVTFGNRVEAHGSNNSITINGKSVGAAGGIAGINDGYIYDVGTTGTVIAGSAVTGSSALSTAGGIVGINNANATVDFSYSDSAVTASDNSTYGLGGVAGVNNGTLKLVDSLGVTRGLYVDQNGNYLAQSGQVGGIVGINNNTINSGYNESIVTGLTEVGGIAGVNDGTINSVVNAVSVTGDGKDAAGSQDEVAAGYYVGGLVGTNTGSVTNGRNNGTITGNNYVGGLVGDNANANSILTNLVNDSSAEILGEEYVGGIAGKNSGTISATNDGLTNRGSITGQKYVGGVAGLNTGSITNTNNDVSLNVKNENAEGENAAEYFGGVVGRNKGTINSATNSADITANGATYVGGIAGYNDGQGVLVGMGNSNEGNVVGKDFVGGVIGRNEGNIGTTDSTVKIVNSGQVTATDGGAGGLIAYNAGDLTNVEMTNAGLVKGTGSSGASGTGGLIGYNEGDITGSVLENTVGFVIDDETFDGDVTGLNNVGGVIGVNTGKIENTSLMNKADITVTVGENPNAENIGGLIGKNTGEIEGGRDALDEYYKYQIYNNGTITVTGKGENIGGLIGSNTGSLTAGYNTGEINASGSENVGGIVGNNAGTVDQVFNTVMTGVDNEGKTVYGAITGDTNVGGLVGANSGTLSNAYNTTAVEGKLPNAVVGNAVGENTGANANVEFVYDVTNTNNKLIGKNSGSVTGSYALQESGQVENAANGITYISEDEANDKEGYDKFASNTWKFYDGQQTPLLSVFLTKVKIDQDKVNEYMSAHKVYNGTEQELTADDIKTLITNGAIYVEGLTKEQAFEAFDNNNDLISSIGYKNVGEHSNWLYSDQIAAGSTDNSFNPNNLGYDIELKASLSQAELSISDILANIVYGGNTYTNIKGGVLTGDYYKGDDVYLTINGMPVTIDSNFISGYLSDTYKDAQGGRNTADVKRDQDGNVIAYDNAILINDINLGGNAAGNYKLKNNSISGDITVTPKSLNITLNDIYRIYGDHNTIYGNYEATQIGGYGIKDVIGLVNGDEISKDRLVVTATSDGALDNFANPTKTSDVKADGYTWSGSFSGIDNVNSNYTITIDEGKSFVKAKTITVKDLLATIVYGNQDEKGFVLDSNSKLDLDGLAYNDNVTINGNAVYNVIANSAYYNELKGRDTADVGSYKDSLSVSGITLSGEKAGNYHLDTTAAVGDIEVKKATLNVTFNDVEHIYGSADLNNNTNYGINNVTGIVNQDTEEDINNSLSFVFVNGSDTALTGLTGGRVTNDVGSDYEYKGTVSTTNNNYNVIVNGTNSDTGTGKSEVTKATIKINLDDITHVYGRPSDDYKIKDDIIWVNGDAYSVNDLVIADNTINDDAIDKTTGKTNNAGGQYKWVASVDAIGNNAEIINQNYNFEVVKGNSSVDQAELTINLGDITHTYGKPDKDGYTFTANGWAYGEDYSADISIGSLGNGITDNALKDSNEHTQNVNSADKPYSWTTNDYSISGEGAVNYKITVVNEGKSYVDKANLVITADNANTTIGNMPDRFTGTDIQDQLVNGDIINDGIYHYGVNTDTDVNVVGKHNIGIYINGTYYELQNPDWSDENGLGFFANYNVTFVPGTLTVTEQVMPDLPGNWPNNRWDYLFADNPFDRNENFRERKAEVNFVDGAMEI